MRVTKILSTLLIATGVIIPFSSTFATENGAKPQCVSEIHHASASSSSTAGNQTVATPASDKKTALEPDKEILFFMNPNGHPCQMQLSILDGMKDKLSSLAKIKYIKTTESSDQNTFYQYGIRGLPSLIILNKDGKELKRFTPGIQDEKTILSALTDAK